MRSAQTLIFILFWALGVSAQQKQVAITMDDLPFNALSGRLTTAEYAAWNTRLLDKIAATRTPVAAFITGNGSLHPGETDARLAILRKWAALPEITPANHTFHHPNCTELASPAAFAKEVLSCETIVEQAWPAYADSQKYFRFPFNAVGRDTANREQLAQVLSAHNYTSTPFTIESSDYIFNALYVDALNSGAYQDAEALAAEYIQHTVEVFRFYEAFCDQYYQRSVSHIYLCHANQLHADYYQKLVAALKAEGYAFIRLDEALQDSLYTQTDQYYKKWGISWLYRWMSDPELRMQELRKSPDPNRAILEAYNNR